MKIALLLSAAVAFLSCSAVADEGESFSFIKTTTGKVYTNCRIFKMDPDGVIIVHDYGGAKLLFADLTAESRTALGYDAKKLAAYEKERAELKKEEREELWKYRRELAKAQAAAYTADARRLEVIAVQNLASGGYGGYGYGWDPFGGFGYGLGLGYGFGNGYGFDRGFGHRFGGFPLRHGHFHRGKSVFPTPANFGTANFIGRTFHAPHRGVAPLATPAMGPLTPALGGGRP
jgi:hypothetical protein